MFSWYTEDNSLPSIHYLIPKSNFLRQKKNKNTCPGAENFGIFQQIERNLDFPKIYPNGKSTTRNIHMYEKMNTRTNTWRETVFFFQKIEFK